MKIKYFDSHSHLNFPQYNEDREDIIKEMNLQGIATICVGTDKKTSEESVALAGKHEHIWATIGLHPTELEEFDVAIYKKMLTEKVVGIGECGLDYFRLSQTHPDLTNASAEKIRQKGVFNQQIQFALANNLPLMLHCRPSNASMDAYNDALDILEGYSNQYGDKLRGNAHFFVGNGDVAQRFLDIGFTIAFPGVITFTSEYDDVVRMVPLQSILSETDAPYVAPDPYRGKRNSPIYVKEVVSSIAYLKGKDESAVREATITNAKRVFGID